MITWPTKLIEDIASRRAVLFFGSGVSLNSTAADGSRPASWWAFLDGLRSRAMSENRITSADNKILRRLLKEGDLLSVCDVLKYVLGREDFVERVKLAYKTPGFHAAEIHKLIYRLDLRIVATPNFDEIYETYARSASNSTCTVKQHTDNDLAECLRGNERVILKIHGSVSNPNELVFTRSEYAQARTKSRYFYALLESLLRTHTFLFVGCGLADPDIRLLLEDYAFSFAQSRKHYFTIPSGILGGTTGKVIGDSLNLQFLHYSDRNNHKELTESMTQLVSAVELDRKRLADGQLW